MNSTQQLLLGILIILVIILFYILLGVLTAEFYIWHRTQHHTCTETWRLGIERHKPPQDRNYLRAKTAYNITKKKHSWAHKYHDPDKIALYWPVVLLWYKRGTPVDLTRY